MFYCGPFGQVAVLIFMLFSAPDKVETRTCFISNKTLDGVAAPWRIAVSIAKPEPNAITGNKEISNTVSGIYLTDSLVLITDPDFLALLYLRKYTFRVGDYTLRFGSDRARILSPDISHLRAHPNFSSSEQGVWGIAESRFLLLHLKGLSIDNHSPCLPVEIDMATDRVRLFREDVFANSRVFFTGVTPPFNFTAKNQIIGVTSRDSSLCEELWNKSSISPQKYYPLKSLDGLYYRQGRLCTDLLESSPVFDKNVTWDYAVLKAINEQLYLYGIVVNPSPQLQPIPETQPPRKALFFEKLGEPAFEWMYKNHKCALENRYTCNSGQCIELRYVCDNATDCEDGSDEESFYCDSLCHAGKRPCGIGNCVLTDQFTKLCDNIKTKGINSRKLAFILAGSIIPSVLIVSAILIMCFIRMRKLKEEIRNLTPQEVEEFLNGIQLEELSNEESNERKIMDLVQSMPWDMTNEIPRCLIEIEHEITRGHFGIVSKAKLKKKKSGYFDAVVKMPIPSIRVTEFKSLLDEVKVMSCIGSHEHVVGFFGACTQNIRKRDVLLVMEYCTNGNLLSYLIKNRLNFHARFAYANVEISNKSFDINQLLTWAAQAASGFEYLAFNKVIHRDIAARNLLLSNTMRIKIGDFGLSRKLVPGDDVYTATSGEVPWKWLAPEAFQLPPSYSEKSDIWAFGITLWEMFSLGEVPYGGRQWEHKFPQEIEQGLRLQKPTIANDEVYGLMEKCWSIEAPSRPTFAQAKQLLIEIASNIEQRHGSSSHTNHMIDEYFQVIN